MGNLAASSVLIVDDDADVLKVVRTLVSEFGYEAVGCPSAKEALKLLKRRKFDVLLTDLMLPEMDGIKLMKKARETVPHLTCIMVTGKGTVETAVQAMKVGAFDYISKPLMPDILKAALSRAMEVRRLRESEEKYRTIVEDQTELICRWLPYGKLTYANEVYCRYFGKKCRDLIGKPLLHVSEEEWERLQKRVGGLTSETPVSLMEHPVVMPDGEVRWQQWSDRAIFDGRGNIVEYQSVGRDVTDRKKAEEALHKSKEELNERIKELEEFYQLAVGRELRMIELKEEIERLREELARPKKSRV